MFMVLLAGILCDDTETSIPVVKSTVVAVKHIVSTVGLNILLLLRASFFSRN